jgi:hypothetical protein
MNEEHLMHGLMHGRSQRINAKLAMSFYQLGLFLSRYELCHPRLCIYHSTCVHVNLYSSMLVYTILNTNLNME